MVAGQKGTTVSVEGLFKRLPVRRRDLEKNIKREYGKVLNLLHAYACIGTGVRFSVKNTVGKTRNVVVFATSGNQTTKQNIANVYGAKTLSALIPLGLSLVFEPSTTGKRFGGGCGDQDEKVNKIRVQGHISRPVFGEGRQTPDRQMFFVNSRPCGLPQIAKAFNEVYKSFNVSQSPFIFADFHMNTNAYDVNVSPDKRTILLHDAGAMIESLKTSLTQMFESVDQTVPQSQLSLRQPSFGGSQASVTPSKPSGRDIKMTEEEERDESSAAEEEVESSQRNAQGRMKSFLSDLGSQSRRTDALSSPARPSQPDNPPAHSSPILPSIRPKADDQIATETCEDQSPEKEEPPTQPATQETETKVEEPSQSTTMSDEQPASLQADTSTETPNAVQNAFDRMRPRRTPAEVATITIGDKTVTSMVGSGMPKKREADSIGPTSNFMDRKRRIHTPSRPNIFSQHMKGFAAPGSQATESSDDEAEEAEEEEVEEADDAEDIRDEQSKDGSRSEARSPEESDDDHDYGVEHEHEEEQEQERVQERHLLEHDAGEVQMHDTQPAPNDTKEMTEEEKKAHEEAEVQRLIQKAEDKAALPEDNTTNRANKMNKGAAHRDSTVHLIGSVDGSLSKIQSQMDKMRERLRSQATDALKTADEDETAMSQQTAEDRLSLTVTKDDFAKMRIIGQFNLGFIIATRSSSEEDGADTSKTGKDELFIIDQHASDEKINFERLQVETAVQNQRLVQPKTLDLTAVEEEIVLENRTTLEKNGFIVGIDDSGNEPIGRRCKLISLPLSKEVVFGVRDLEELIVLLSEMPATDVYIPRPSKVRKMFAMRACRSSIMIGKNLTTRQMERVVRNMGTIDKPWNCPHGRPTMRHLMSLGQWDEWDEFGEGEDGKMDVWREFFHDMEEEEE